MIFPENITGPQFSDGDFVTYRFDDCELTLRLPVIPHNTDKVDDVSPRRDYRNVDTRDWRPLGEQGFTFFRLATQKWKYECKKTHDNIASCYMKISVLKHTQEEVESLFSLNSDSFRNHHLEVIQADFYDYEQKRGESWPSASNNFLAKTISSPVLDGLQVELDLVDGAEAPTLSALFSLGKEYTLNIEWSFGSLHYPDRQNPYSKELLHKMKFELFDEFLSFIDIEYSPETLALIQQLKAT